MMLLLTNMCRCRELRHQLCDRGYTVGKLARLHNYSWRQVVHLFKHSTITQVKPLRIGTRTINARWSGLFLTVEKFDNRYILKHFTARLSNNHNRINEGVAVSICLKDFWGGMRTR